MHGEMGQERLHFRRSYILWMPFLMKEDKTLNPIDVGSLGADAIMLQANNIANLSKKFWLLRHEIFVYDG